MIGSPRFLASFWNNKTYGQIIQVLENEFNGNAVLVFRDDFLTEVLFKNTSDDEDDFANYLLEGVKGKRVRFGKNVPESVSGVQFVSNDGIGGTRFAIDGIETRLAIPGLYNYTNALGCVALA